MTDSQPIATRLQQTFQLQTKRYRALKEIADRLAEANDLDPILDLMSRQRVIAQHIQQTAIGEIEQGRCEPSDMRGRTLARRETIKRRVQRIGHAQLSPETDWAILRWENGKDEPTPDGSDLNGA